MVSGVTLGYRERVESAEGGTVTKQLTAAELAERCIRFLAAKDMDALNELFDDDARWELAYPLDGVDGDDLIVTGKAVLSKFHRMLMRGIDHVDMFDIDVHAVSDDLAFAQFRSSGVTVKGTPYGNRYVARCDARNGRIVHWLEFFDPRPAEMIRADLAETLAARPSAR